MISWTDVNLLEKQKLDLQLRLNQLLNSNDNSMSDEINSIRAEILHVDKQIKKIVGKNEIARQEKLKVKKSGQIDIIIKNFEIFKSKYRRVSNIYSAMNAMMNFIDEYNSEITLTSQAPVKVMH